MSHFHESLHPDDVPDWHKGEWDGETARDEEQEPEPEREPEPDYDAVKFEDTATYRDQLRDAGRGHLVRW